MTCRDEILEAFADLSKRTDRDTFSPAEIIAEMRRKGTTYAESTIRTHIVSRMCSNAPDHHAVVYSDLERVGPGLYRVHSTGSPSSRANEASPESAAHQRMAVEKDPSSQSDTSTASSSR